MIMNPKNTFLTANHDQPLDIEVGTSTGDDDSKHLITMSTNSGDVLAAVPLTNQGGNRTLEISIFLILFIGMTTASVFIWFGVSTATEAQENEFDRAAVDTTNKIKYAFEDYVNAASTVHMRCRHRNFTRQDFRETYEYLIAGGLQFKAVQFDPNTTHAERADAEEEVRSYYAENYPQVDYQGFRGFNYPNSTSLNPRLDRPFYFPVQYQEPTLGNEAALGLDYYSSESRTRAVDALFEKQGPSLTDRLSLVKKAGSVSRCGDHNGPSYGVVLMHPGVALSEPQTGDEIWPRDFSTIVICVPDLIQRSTVGQSESSTIYIHDRSHPSGDGVFMGGARVDVTSGGQHDLTFVDEKSLWNLSGRLMKRSNVQAANRVWTVTVLSEDDTYKGDILFVCLGGATIFAASFVLAVWMYTSTRHTQKYNEVLNSANRSAAIVTSLFPKNVAKQMMDYDVQDPDGRNGDIKSNPIADLFPDTTVMFADLEGFTAWSSMRDPSAVFRLLETLYSAFDKIAARRSVFKVETVGDSYIAVCGLPEPRCNHAEVMARFAHDCSKAAKSVTRSLEVELGPETSTLDFRFGLHSGPVTGGVLRGQKARFQLFGDTVNTASRMEATSKKGRIQLSMATADILREFGKGHWVIPRDEKVLAKGIGVVQTCWLEVKVSPNSATNKMLTVSDRQDASNSRDTSETGDDEGAFRSKLAGLVDWHSESLARFLKVVVAEQQAQEQSVEGDDIELDAAEQTILDSEEAPIDEISDNIDFPTVRKLNTIERAAESIELDPKIRVQLDNFVWNIAATYKQVPFHNFEHASHVVMSVMKLLGSASNHKDNGLDDPLARFTLVLAAIVHDADHQGVPNGQLNKEKDSTALLYDNKSAAEQNSLDITWTLLMKDEYKDLRRAIYKNEEDLFRFRRLLVHTVLVTDIVNKELQGQRKERWNRVFGSSDKTSAVSGESTPLSTNDSRTKKERMSERKTALLELVIQASDVSHTMQHWHIYRQWNTCLFHEQEKAWKEGRGESDPRKSWYQGEIGFFKFYILPLADRVKYSSAFGALGAELYQSAHSNLTEWTIKGERIVQELSMAEASVERRQLE